ncbi:MAG TPA: DUF3108 domain-containing protein [Bryobacteraceae bacterium]|nr:DUF3108 domain-containing protein [Bryobacteraceae bacterium]
MPARLDTRHALALVVLLSIPAQSFQTSAAHNAGVLPHKEGLNYTVEWRLIDAGKAKLTWNLNSQPSHPGWEVKLHLESTGLVSKLYKVFDDYTADLTPDLCAQDTHLNAHEGSRQRETSVHYDAGARKAHYLERDLVKHNVALAKESEIPRCVHDVIGSLFFLRTLNLDPGHSIEVSVSDGKKSVSAKVEAQRREEIKVPAGTFKTVKYEAYLFNNVLYRRDGHLYVWLTDDQRKVPIRIQVRLQFAIGTITAQLEKEEKT